MEQWILDRIPEDEFGTYSHHVGWECGVFWTLYYKDHESGHDGWYSSKQEPQSAWKKAMWTTRAFTSAATKTPRFTDYVMPFFVTAIQLLLIIFSFFTSRFSAAL